MKKTFLLPAFMLSMVIAANAQDKKAPPPPPPVPPEVEQAQPPPPPPPVPPSELADEKMDAFYKRNPGIARIARKTSQQDVIVILKNNNTEKYNMANEADKKAFTNKYGEMPDVAPPPPPPPPAPPIED